VILAIDPGPTESAFLLYDPATREVGGFGKWKNERLVSALRKAEVGTFACVDVVVVEMIASYGMPVGREVFETCVVIGQLLEAWGRESERLYRTTAKLHVCGNTRARDGNVRAALIDAFGGKAKAIGTSKDPGPLHGVSGDVWAALAVAVTYADRTEQARAA
jgi:hypothetical protein